MSDKRGCKSKNYNRTMAAVLETIFHTTCYLSKLSFQPQVRPTCLNRFIVLVENGNKQDLRGIIKKTVFRVLNV
jgi:hypothetical protein